ncbi:hypothetical protein D3C81_1623380 [compost metagenome]
MLTEAVLATFRSALPKAVLPIRLKEPSSTFSAPPKVLLPLRVSSLAPCLFKSPLPLMTPLRVRSWLPARVRLPLRSTELARLAVLLLSSVVPLATTNAPLPSAALLPSTRVPPLRAVPPL